MKIVRLAILSATAAFAAMAFIGASSASAADAHKAIQLCGKNELLLCPKANLLTHPLKSRLTVTQLGSSEFKAVFTIKCASGSGNSAAIEPTQLGKETVISKLEKLTFTACEGGCKKVVVKENVEAILEMTETPNPLEGTWFLKVPLALVTFSECTFGTSCMFIGELKLKIQMNATESYFEPEGQSLKLEESSKIACGETGKWTVGKNTFKWQLDDGAGGAFKTEDPVWPTLLEKLTEA